MIYKSLQKIKESILDLNLVSSPHFPVVHYMSLFLKLYTLFYYITKIIISTFFVVIL